MAKEDRNAQLLRQRLRWLLSWATRFVPGQLRIVEFRMVGIRSAVPELMPLGHGRFEDLVEVVDVAKGLCTITETLPPRALVCGGVLERLLYPCHDLLRAGVRDVGCAPQLCGASGRFGELSRANTMSHMEHVLGVRVLESLRTAARWLLPEAPALRPSLSASAPSDVNIVVEARDGTELSEDQSLVVSLLLPRDVIGVKLHKIGKGWTSALKFFCVPLVVAKDPEVDEAIGATTFIKMGKQEQMEEELNVTKYMDELLGGFCPQVLGYAEHGKMAAIHLSLADLCDGAPRGLADLYHEMLLPEKVETRRGRKLLHRIMRAVDFTCNTLLNRLHSTLARHLRAFSLADELGLCRDLPTGKTGMERDLHVSSAFLLEKVWGRAPGDGGLASSTRMYMNMVLGEKEARSTMLTFLPEHGLELPNVCSQLLESSENLTRLMHASQQSYRLCFVHGDLHGDNIMIDSNNNHFLIDFGKTRLGHCMEDLTYLESHILLSYTEFLTDEELSDTLNLVMALAPSSGVTPDSCRSSSLESAVVAPLSGPRTKSMWAIVKLLRLHLRKAMLKMANISPGLYEEELHRVGFVASLLLLRNSLFFLAARENRQNERRRRLALAFACAYAQGALAMAP